MKKLAIASLIFLAFGGASASQAAEGYNPNHFFTVHEVLPVLTPSQDIYGKTINVVHQVDLLIQFPGKLYAERIRANLKDTLFLDPRAPLPGQIKYNAVIGLDGKIEE